MCIRDRHKSGIDMSRDLLRRSHVLVVCGHSMTESMKNDIAVAQRLGITATTLEMCIRDRGVSSSDEVSSESRQAR